MKTYKTLYKIVVDTKSITKDKFRVQLASRTSKELPKLVEWVEVDKIEIEKPEWIGISKSGISIQFENKACKIEEEWGHTKLTCKVGNLDRNR